MGKQNLMNKLHYFLLTSATTLAAIKTRLRSNSELLEASSTLRAAKVVVLDGFLIQNSGYLHYDGCPL